ncbi:MAG: hypothetical protein HDR19_06075 [Lachnospiraceae bacterium]|nr:hypothetical protein [Lachnospiraceae bacterium]
MIQLVNFGKKTLIFMAAVVFAFNIGINSFQVNAAEFSVIETSAVLYTNENTVICNDADENSIVILSEVEEGLPIQVTGVTSNGYFRILLDGQTFYIHGIGLQAGELPNIDDGAAAGIYDKMIAQKANFPEGMAWTNDNFYAWKGGIYSGGYGCAGFAFAVSDAAFGEAGAVIHKDYNNIKIGDILRVNYDTHSVIVLEVKADSVIVAEGNYNGAIHWGREIPKSELVDEGSYIMTRY